MCRLVERSDSFLRIHKLAALNCPIICFVSILYVLINCSAYGNITPASYFMYGSSRLTDVCEKLTEQK